MLHRDYFIWNFLLRFSYYLFLATEEIYDSSIIFKDSKKIEIPRDDSSAKKYTRAWKDFCSLLPKIKAVEVVAVAVVRHGMLFTRDTYASPAVRRDRARKGYPMSIHRIFTADAGRVYSPRWLFTPEGGEGKLLPPLKMATLCMQSTWLIAGVTLALLTFGIEWQLGSPPACCRA